MRDRFARAFVHIVLLCGLAVTLVPLIWVLGASFKAPKFVLASTINPLPLQFSVANYVAVYQQTQVIRQLVNSLVFAGGVTLGQLAIAIPAAYAFARNRGRISDAVFSLLLLTLPIPFVVEYVPNYILMSQLGWLNTFAALILPQIANVYGLFLLRQHFRAFPHAIIESAKVDGCSEIGVLARIMLPATRGAVAAVAVYVFIMTWNEYVWPLLVAPNGSMQVITVAVANFASSEGGIAWGSIMAAATVASIPTVIVYIFLRRQVLAAFVDGAVKG